MSEDFVCNITIKPVLQWLKDGEKDGNCPPCLIKPLASAYLGAQEEVKEKKQIHTLKKAWNTGEALTIAETLDNIKDEVGDILKKNLVRLDCMAQSHKE